MATPILLKANGTVIPAMLNDTVAAQDFKKRLPFTAAGHRSAVDYCCRLASGIFDPAQTQSGWKNGDISLAGGWFAVLFDGKENSSDYRGMMVIAHIDEKDLGITTKLWIQDAGYENAKKAFQVSLDKLGLDYIDLYLIHQPMNDYYGSWRAMEELYEEGKVRAIGVCNFYPERLADLCLNARIKPMVNQVELHPFFAQTGALETMKEFGVQPEAWGPMAEGKHGIFIHPVLTEIGAKYGKTAAQIALKWNVQRGFVIIPKSVHKERMEENFDIWDFRLSDEDMEAIGALDLGHSEIIDHSAADTAKFLNGWKIHE